MLQFYLVSLSLSFLQRGTTLPQDRVRWRQRLREPDRAVQTSPRHRALVGGGRERVLHRVGRERPAQEHRQARRW